MPARVVISIIQKTNKYEIVGYVDQKDKGLILGVPYLGNDDDFVESFKSNIEAVVLGVGQIKTPKLRKAIVNKYKGAGFKFSTIISPDSIVNKEVQIGNGTVVMDGVVINTETEIGKYSIINTNSTIEHDCKIGDYVHIAPGVTMSGEVKIDNNCLIGVGSTIIQGISIISNVVLGAGSIVHKDVTESGVYVGNPLRKIE